MKENCSDALPEVVFTSQDKRAPKYNEPIYINVSGHFKEKKQWLHSQIVYINHMQVCII